MLSKETLHLTWWPLARDCSPTLKPNLNLYPTLTRTLTLTLTPTLPLTLILTPNQARDCSYYALSLAVCHTGLAPQTSRGPQAQVCHSHV